MPETITIPKDEYERLKSVAMKIKLIDETIHENLNSQNLMRPYYTPNLKLTSMDCCI